jgi:D-3-phosphoglycerate dehydrogenase
MARVAVTDGIDEKAAEVLRGLGHEVVIGHHDLDSLQNGSLSNFDIVVIRSATKLGSDVINANSKDSGSLSMIIRAGVGVDNIDIDAATSCGVMVCNTPSASTNAVVELTIGLLLSSVRNVTRSDRRMRGGEWAKKEMRGSELRGKRLGLIGYGRIARGVAEIGRNLGMEIHAFDPYIEPDLVDDYCTLHEEVDSLFRMCTHISVHCFLSPETRNLVNSRRVSLMPKIGADGIKCGNHIVNCARGGIVHEDEIRQSLIAGDLTTAALDVFEIEPATDNDLLEIDRFTSTPHIGAATKEAQSRIGDEIISIINSFESDEIPDSALN